MHVCVRAHHALHPGRRDLRGRRQSGSSYVRVLLPPERTCRPLAALLGAQLRPCHRTPPAPPVHPSRKATPHVGVARSPRPALDARPLPPRDILPPLPKKRKRVMPLDALCTPEPLPPGSPEDRPQAPRIASPLPVNPSRASRTHIRARLSSSGCLPSPPASRSTLLPPPAASYERSFTFSARAAPSDHREKASRQRTQ